VQSLPAVGRGAFVPLSPTQAQSIAFPSPLSLDWALNEIVPQLGDAARK
jgi:iron complex transport system substrate-binding protein